MARLWLNISAKDRRGGVFVFEFAEAVEKPIGLVEEMSAADAL